MKSLSVKRATRSVARFDPAAASKFSERLRASLRQGDDTQRIVSDAKLALDSELLAIENEMRLRKLEVTRAFSRFVADVVADDAEEA